jgi:hypothetical protein
LAPPSRYKFAPCLVPVATEVKVGSSDSLRAPYRKWAASSRLLRIAALYADVRADGAVVEGRHVIAIVAKRSFDRGALVTIPLGR